MATYDEHPKKSKRATSSTTSAESKEQKNVLMKKKQLEHQEMFSISASQKNVLGSLRDSFAFSSKLLNKLNKDLKKSKNRDVFKKSVLSVLSSTLNLANYMVKVALNSDLDESSRMNAIKKFINLISFIKNIEAVIASKELERLTKVEFLQLKDELYRTSFKVFSLMQSAMSESKNYGYALMPDHKNSLDDISNKYETKIENLLKSMKQFGSKRPSKVPLMGSEGGG